MGLEPPGDGAVVLLTVAVIVLMAAWDIVEGRPKTGQMR